MKSINTLAVIAASFSTMAAAQTERDLGSHEHGSAFLNVAVLDGALTLELETPWNNLTGFEHEPRTDAQHALIDDALARLNQPDELFAFKGTTCSAAETMIEDGLAHDEHDEHEEDEEHAEHDEHEEDEEDEEHEEHDEHDEDEEHAEHDEHDEDKEHAEHDDEDAHSELLVSYSFSCDDIAQLESIDVNLLEIWSGFEELDVQLIGPGGQNAIELNPQQTLIDVTQVQ